MARNTKKKRKVRHLTPGQKLLVVVILLAVFAICSTVFLDLRRMDEQERPSADGSGWSDSVTGFVLSLEGTTTAPFYNEGFAEVAQYPRGEEVEMESWEPFVSESGVEYYHVYLDGQYGYIPCENITDDRVDILQENRVYVRSTVHLLPVPGEPQLGSLVEKGVLLRLMGYDYFRSDGTVNMYQVKLGDELGWIKSDYVTFSYEDAMKDWNSESNSFVQHQLRGDEYGGGDATEMDYFPHEKGDFAAEGNAMPASVYALYISADDTSPAVVERYLEMAKGSQINTFVFTIMDSGVVAYNSPWLAGYGLTTGQYTCYNTLEDFASSVKMVQDAGYYVVARISAFQDVPLAQAHPEWSIADVTGMPMLVDDSYWPSPFCRDVWQLKVGLGVEAVDEFGFNEVMFDFVRFPNYIPDNADLRNTYGEDRSQALQRFLTYACDVLHNHNAYVSSTMFMETANRYVAPNGQYWPAISTVVDVICGQPYPEDFGSYFDYGAGKRHYYYKYPYDTIYDWAQNVVDRQSECSTPAIVRTWVQTWDMPGYKYDSAAITKEIVALYDAGLTGGYMCWHRRGNLYVQDDLAGVITQDFTALYQAAVDQGQLLSAYMGISTVDT